MPKKYPFYNKQTGKWEEDPLDERIEALIKFAEWELQGFIAKKLMEIK